METGLFIVGVILALVFTVERFWIGLMVLFALMLLNLSIRLGSRVKATSNGGIVLDYGSGMTWFAIIGALLLATLLIYDALTFDPIRLNQPEADIIERASISMGLFAILVWPMFIEGTFSWYVINDKGIDKHSAWNRRLFMQWGEVDSITFTAVNQWFVIKGANGSVRLHAYLDGLKEFAIVVRTHVPREKWKKVGDIIESLASGKQGIVTDIGTTDGVNQAQSPARARKIPKRP
jgi:hypothetical protein